MLFFLFLVVYLKVSLNRNSVKVLNYAKITMKVTLNR